MTTKTAPKTTTQAEARKHAQETADRVAKWPAAKKRKMIADCEKYLNESAPTMEAASSDLLMMLMAVGMEFIRKYYPDATAASFHISRYEKSDHQWSAMVPVPIPEVATDDEN